MDVEGPTVGGPLFLMNDIFAQLVLGMFLAFAQVGEFLIGGQVLSLG